MQRRVSHHLYGLGLYAGHGAGSLYEVLVLFGLIADPADATAQGVRASVGELGMRWISALFVLGALAVVSAGGAIFFGKLGKSLNQVTATDLAAFGTYFGGVAGPLLAFLTIVGLVLTLLMQNRQIEQVAEANLKDQHVRMLIEIGHDLEAMEGQHLDVGLTLGDLLNGRVQLQRPAVDALRVALPRYVRVLGYYAEGVAMYRGNVSPYFDCRAFEQRGLRLLDRIAPHVEHVGQMGGVTLAIIRGHLENTLQKGKLVQD